MRSQKFSQEQKLSIVKNAAEIGFKKAAKIAGIHYTTVYDWQRGYYYFIWIHERIFYSCIISTIKSMSSKNTQLIFPEPCTDQILSSNWFYRRKLSLAL